MRHYLNIRILLSVWNDFETIPEYYRSWVPPVAHPGRWWIFDSFGHGQVPPWIKCVTVCCAFTQHRD